MESGTNLPRIIIIAQLWYVNHGYKNPSLHQGHQNKGNVGRSQLWIEIRDVSRRGADAQPSSWMASALHATSLAESFAFCLDGLG